MKTNEGYQSVGTESREKLPANPYRTYLFIQNQDAAAVLAVNFGHKGKGSGTDGLLILPGQYYEFTQDNGAPEELIFMSSTVATNLIYVLEGVR